MIPSHHKHCQKFTEVWPYKSITCYLHICKSLKVGTPSNCCLIYKQFVKWLFLEKTVFIIFEYDLRLSLPEMRLLLDAITFWLERSKVMRFLFSLVHRNGVKLTSILGIVVFWFCFDRSSRLVPSVFSFSQSSLYFYISFLSFRPDYLSILYDSGVVPLWKHISMCMFSFQASTRCALCSILSATCTTFAVWMSKKVYKECFLSISKRHNNWHSSTFPTWTNPW